MNNALDPALLHAPVININHHNQDKVAFFTEHDSITYSQLRQSVLQGANWLIESGCKPGDRIGICLPKNLYTVELIFATLAAGAVFVPIDPAAPPARVAYILQDADALRVFTYPHMAEALRRLEQPITSELTLIDSYDSFRAMIRNAKNSHALPVGHTHDTALLYYTSGTTGTPKAIMLSHANVTSFTGWAIATFGITGDDRVASHAPFHFDLSTLDLFAATGVGASVVLLDEASVKFPSRISQILETAAISVWYSVPTALIQLLRYGALERRKLEALRLILFAGEVFPVPELAKLVERLPWCEFANLYGPTETNVCTYYRLTGPPRPDTKDIPVGIACEHLQVGLYQEDGTESPPGENGEITVFGPAVMQGYWNRPELTARSRFNNNVNSYRTGDFAHRDDAGQLHLVGRRDDQVKIRGHRVELLEVTSVLTIHPAVMEAMVLLSDPADGEAALIAFIVPEPTRTVTLEDIQGHCRQWLPKYAIPKRVLILDRLPRTATGKIDRQKLKLHPNFRLQEN